MRDEFIVKIVNDPRFADLTVEQVKVLSVLAERVFEKRGEHILLPWGTADESN